VKRVALVVAGLLLVPLLLLPALAAAADLAQPVDAGCPGIGAPTGGGGLPGGSTGSIARGAALAAVEAARAGFRGADLVVAVAVAGAESSYNPLARNSIGASGLWQILESAHPDLFARYHWQDPAQNAVMAYSVWRAAGGSWTPWTTWTGGSYLQYLSAARIAVAAVGGTIPTTDPCTPTGPGPKPYPGGPTGCVIPDPSGTGGCVTAALAWLMAQVQARFGHLPVSCWSARGGDPYSDHPKGRACDYTIGRIGTYPGPADVARGWALATWLCANAIALHVDYVIWQGRIWSRAHNSEGWRIYTGGGVYSPTGVTNGHYDHVHVSVV
jgi:Lysozyme like domain